MTYKWAYGKSKLKIGDTDFFLRRFQQSKRKLFCKNDNSRYVTIFTVLYFPQKIVKRNKFFIKAELLNRSA
jgi:hypothetical protein